MAALRAGWRYRETRCNFSSMSRVWFAPLALLLMAPACRGDGLQSGLEPSAYGGEAVRVNNFSWVINGKLAGMADPNYTSVEGHMKFLAEENVEFLVSLTEEGTDPQAAQAEGITVVHIPLADFTAPTMDQLQLFVWVANAAIAEDRAIGVHCGAGLGRTGTFLAAFFVADGMTAEDAINHVRELRPGSVETPEQHAAVKEFELLLASAD